jgi:hypothetical protein
MCIVTVPGSGIGEAAVDKITGLKYFHLVTGPVQNQTEYRTQKLHS